MKKPTSFLLPDEDSTMSHHDAVQKKDNVLHGEAYTPKTYGSKGAYLWGTAIMAAKLKDVT